jgi:hypothetical protein
MRPIVLSTTLLLQERRVQNEAKRATGLLLKRRTMSLIPTPQYKLAMLRLDKYDFLCASMFVLL